MLDAQRTFLTARERYAEALREAAAALPALEHAIGAPFARILESEREAGDVTVAGGRDAVARGVNRDDGAACATSGD